MVGAYVTGQPAKIEQCPTCGETHESGHHTPGSLCIEALRARVAELRDALQHIDDLGFDLALTEGMMHHIVAKALAAGKE